jgi:putative (di)nucleoside polyphosphate hydrolase
MSTAFFRANVGACVFNALGQVLALKRKGAVENSWQMPQGGIEDGEDPQTAVWRELQEETGLLEHEAAIITELPDWLVYELPIEDRNAKVGWGQVQKWFLIRVLATPTVRPDSIEFENFAWLAPPELMPLVVPFRRSTYERVFGVLDRIVEM